MNLDAKKVPHYLIVVLSVIYNSYAAGNYGSKFVDQQSAYVIAFLLSALGHYFLVLGVQTFRTEEVFNANILIAVILSGSCIYADLNGVSTISHVKHVAPVSDKFDSQIAEMEKALQSTQADISKSRIKAVRTDLIALETRQQQELDNKRAEKETALSVAETNKTQQEKGLSVFSIIAFVLSLAVADLLARAETKQQQQSQEQEQQEPQFVVTKRVMEQPPICEVEEEKPIQKVAKVEEHPQQTQIGFKPSKVNLLKDLWWKEGVKDTRKLAKELKVNFMQLKALKQEAGIPI